MFTYLPLLRSEKLTSSFLRQHSFLLRQPLLLVRQPLLEKVVRLGIVDGNMNDHIWKVAPLLGIVEANRWKMASLGMLIPLLLCEYRLVGCDGPSSPQLLALYFESFVLYFCINTLIVSSNSSETLKGGGLA